MIAFCCRVTLVMVTCLGTVIPALMNDFYMACTFWYARGIGHYDPDRNQQCSARSLKTQNVNGVFSSFSCLVSAGFLMGTIFWVRRLTQASKEADLQTGTLNLSMVLLHITLILLQMVPIYFYAYNDNSLTLSQSTKI
jgi:hypothetical protein